MSVHMLNGGFVALATAALTYALAAWIPRRPGLINMPGKDRFLRLDPDERAPVVAEVQRLLYWTTTFVLLLFCVVQLMIWREATGQPAAGLALTILVVSVLSGPIVTVTALVRLQRSLDRAWRRHRARAAGR